MSIYLTGYLWTLWVNEYFSVMCLVIHLKILKENFARKSCKVLFFLSFSSYIYYFFYFSYKFHGVIEPHNFCLLFAMSHNVYQKTYNIIIFLWFFYVFFSSWISFFCSLPLPKFVNLMEYTNKAKAINAKLWLSWGSSVKSFFSPYTFNVYYFSIISFFLLF